MHSRKIAAARGISSSNFLDHWRRAAGVSLPRRARDECGSDFLLLASAGGSEDVRRRAGLEGPCEAAGRGGGGRNERWSACTNKWPRFWVINTRAARKEGSVPARTHAHTHARPRPPTRSPRHNATAALPCTLRPQHRPRRFARSRPPQHCLSPASLTPPPSQRYPSPAEPR